MPVQVGDSATKQRTPEELTVIAKKIEEAMAAI